MTDTPTFTGTHIYVRMPDGTTGPNLEITRIPGRKRIALATELNNVHHVLAWFRDEAAARVALIMLTALTGAKDKENHDDKR